MIKQILLALGLGIAAGYGFSHFGLDFVTPDMTSMLLNFLLVAMLLCVGVCLSKDIENFKTFMRQGLRVFLVPFWAAFGTAVGLVLLSFVTELSVVESLAAGMGMGWYSLPAALVSVKSDMLGTVTFLANVFREIISLILIPVFVKRNRQFTAIGLAGAVAMDVALPLVTRTAGEKYVFYSVVSGITLSIGGVLVVSALTLFM